jgi:metal-responsive CopG/Arc/MetJ family transcriptional regulator
LSSSPKRYVNVKVPPELANEVDKILADRRLGYRSRAEFIVEATRQRLMDIRKGAGQR